MVWEEKNTELQLTQALNQSARHQKVKQKRQRRPYITSHLSSTVVSRRVRYFTFTTRDYSVGKGLQFQCLKFFTANCSHYSYRNAVKATMESNAHRRSLGSVTLEPTEARVKSNAPSTLSSLVVGNSRKRHVPAVELRKKAQKKKS